jgi:hypothetical protein
LSYSWQRTFDGVEYGWRANYWRVNEFAWAQASYATLDRVGGGEAAKLGCNALFANPLMARGCDSAAKALISWLIRGYPQYLYHGVWIEYYPWRSKHLYWGRY